jgi:LysR family transcriptional regulator, glycine cleavage system transcriptional activator
MRDWTMPRVEAAEKRQKKDMPPFAALRAFEALVRLGGVRKAAHDLGLHHSVVSRHLTLLESWLGVPLLSWTGKRFEMTAEGELFYGRISVAIAEITLATSELLEGEARRHLNVWCSQGLSIQWLVGQVTEFERQHSPIKVDLKPSDTPANLAVHEADVNIFMHLESEIVSDPGPGLKASVLARPQSMIAASPGLARKLGWIMGPADLLNVPLLHGRHTDDWRWWLQTNGVDVPAKLPGELCWHPYMALEATKLGRGVLLANRFFFENDLINGDLVELKVPGISNAPFGAYIFVAREDRWSSPGVSALRRFLIQRMKVMERT